MQVLFSVLCNEYVMCIYWHVVLFELYSTVYYTARHWLYYYILKLYAVAYDAYNPELQTRLKTYSWNLLSNVNGHVGLL